MPNADDEQEEVAFLRFVATRTRRRDDPLLQLAQFVAYGADGEQLQLVDAQNPGGNNPIGEEAANALDGKDNTKWLDTNKGALECRIASGATKVTRYALVTANDEPNRDPVRWVLEGRLVEGGEWRVLDDKNMGEDQPVPKRRHARLDVTCLEMLPSAEDEEKVSDSDSDMESWCEGGIFSRREMLKADVDALWAMRAASTALQERWPEGESPRSWDCVFWSGDRVQKISFYNSGLEVLAPQIGQLTALTKLILEGCPLKELPPQIGQLTALTNLNLDRCRQLKELPPQIGQLTALTYLSLIGCDQLKELPPQIGQLTALINLNLAGCQQLKELPPQIGQLTALTDLDLHGCKQLKELPPQIGQLLALTNLDLLFGCNQLTLAPGAEKGLLAQTIVAAYARLLIVEPRNDAPGELHAFLRANPLWVPAFFKHIVGDLTGEAIAAWLGEAIKATPDLANLTAPDGRSVTDMAEQARLSRATAKPDEDALRAIRAASTALQEEWPEGGGPRSWRGVTWSGDRVQELMFDGSGLEVLAPQIGQLTALTKLSLSGCVQLKKLPPQIGLLTALKNLNVRDCDLLTLAPGAEVGQPAPTIVAAYTRIFMVEAYKDAPGELHAFLHANPLMVVSFFQTILTDDAHAAWLGEAVTATPVLAKFTAADGRRAIDVAVPACKEAMQAALFLLGRFDVYDGPPEHRSATSVVLRADDHADKPDYAQIFEGADTDKSGTLEGKELDAVAKKLGLSKELVVSESAKQRSATSTDGDQACTRLSKDEFVSACKRLLGDGPRKVVIKLMKDKVQWQREMISRSWEWNAATDKYMPSQNKVLTLDAQYVVQALDAPTQAEMTTAVSESLILQDLAEKYMEKANIKEYAYPVVMDAANRNLAQIYLQERPGLDALRDLARQIFEAVQHLHSRKLMHGDLKTLNLVRSVMDGKLRLIDFDAFGKIFGDDEDGESYACAKFSSGVLPPEALYELNGEGRSQFDEYWADLKDKDPDLWAKVQPKSSKKGKEYVVKTFRTGDDDAKPIKDGLPYELLPASASLDMWSLGVMLYLLFTGENLVPVTRDDDFVSGTGMGYIFDWDDDRQREKLSQVASPAAYDLLTRLLSPKPEERSKQSLQVLLDTHPFFNAADGDGSITMQLQRIEETVKDNNKIVQSNNKLLTAIKDLSTENKTELRRTREVLMKGIFEATEVSKPTTFIVLNEQLPEPTSEEEKKQLMHEIAEDGSGVTVTHELASVTFTEDGPRVEAEGRCKEYVDKFNTGMKWVHRLKTIGSKVAAGKVGDAFKTIKEGLGDLVTGETMYLYLVDELTCEPVRAKGYPIVITTPSEIVPKLLPVMQVGLRAMSIYNGAGGIARLFGYPVPKVPEAWAKGARESVELLKQESSVAQFGVVHEEVMEGSEESKSVRGHSLRVFTDFLQKNDPGLKAGRSGDFAGLQRIGDPNDGTALWTTLTDPQEIKSALEARTREREEEARDGDTYMQRAVESLARQTTTEVRENEKAAAPEVAPSARAEAAAEATNDPQHLQQITSQLSKIQDDLSQLSQIQHDLSEMKRDGVNCTCIIG